MNKHALIQLSTLLVLLFFSVTPAFADLNKKDARRAITRMAGASLPRSAVQIEQITSTGERTAEVSAELELVFRVAQDANDDWHIKELRTGPAKWDDVAVMAQAIDLTLRPNECNRRHDVTRVEEDSGLTNKLARCLIASLLSVSLPSDSVRVKDISTLSLGTEPSALVDSLVGADFRLTKVSNGWMVSEVRTGTSPWVSVNSLPGSLDSLKRERTIEQMNTIVSALQSYKDERGTFVVSDKHSVLIDHLSPHYLSRVIRFDSWQHPYQYHGENDHFTLRSFGPDGKENTADDIVISK